MQQKHLSVDTEALMEHYRALLETVDTLPLEITGSSMTPFLAPGRDSVMLAKPAAPLRPGDIVLYRRDSGAYVLHRIIRLERGGTLTLAGDAQSTLERGIRADQVFAIVRSATRKGKCQKRGCFWWDFFAHVWTHLVPLRARIRRASQRIFSTFGRAHR